MLTDRLRSLVHSGEQKQARELARAAVRNEDIEEVDLSTETITVTTTHFVGEHQRDTGSTIDSKGQYRVRADDFTLEFQTAKLPPKVESRVDELTDTDSEESEPTTDVSGEPATAAMDGGTPTPDSAAPTTTDTTEGTADDEQDGRSLPGVLTSVKNRLLNK